MLKIFVLFMFIGFFVLASLAFLALVFAENRTKRLYAFLGVSLAITTGFGLWCRHIFVGF